MAGKLAVLVLALLIQDERVVKDENRTTAPTTLLQGKPGEYPEFDAVEICADLNVGYAICAADVNADGKVDVVVADSEQFWWFENPSWKKRALTEKGATRKDNVSIAPGDFDGDGRVDFAAGADWRPFDTRKGGDVLWLRRGDDPAKPWTVVKVAEEPTTHRVGAADIDGDGKAELIVVPLMGRESDKAKNWKDAPVRILAYKPGADPAKDPWREIEIDRSLHVCHNFDLADGNLYVASYDGVFLFARGTDGWSRKRIGEGHQLGMANPLVSKEHKSLGAGEVRAGRLPGGGRFVATVEPWHGDQAVAYVEGARHVIDDQGSWGHGVACADIRKAGHDDLIVGYGRNAADRGKPGVVAYVPLDETGSKWRKHVLDEGVAVEALMVADLNGDGKPDIAAAGRATKNVRLFFQK